METTSKSVMKSALALGTGTALNIIISLITTPIITRIVTPDAYGEWSIFTMYTNIALMILVLGLDQALIRFFYDNENIVYRRNLLKTCFTVSMLFTLLAEMILCIVVFAGRDSFGDLKKIILFLCFNIAINVINRFSMITLRVTGKNVIYSICTVLTKATFTVVALFMVLSTEVTHVEGLCIGTICSFLVSTIIAIGFNRSIWKLGPFEKVDNFKYILKYSMPFIISMGVTTLFQSIDKISLNYYCTYTEVGIYASAMTIVNIFAIVQSVFNTMWAPIQVEHFIKKPDDKEFYSKINSFMTIIMFILGGTIIFSKEVIVFLLGNEYRQAAFILPFLIFNPIMYTLSETTNTGIEISKKSYYYIFIGGVSCITNFIGNMLLVPSLKCQGAAISTGISYIVFFGLRTCISLKYFKVNYNLDKIVKITIFLLIFALYSTFKPFDMIYVIMYVLLLLMILFNYKSSICELYKKGKAIISSRWLRV